MNSKTPFEQSKGNIEAKIFSASKNTIIQCPSCLTRYAVDSANLSKSDMPKFHCSRCDHLFGTEDAGHFYSAPANASVEYNLKGNKVPATEIREVTIDLDAPSFRHSKKNHGLEIPRDLNMQHVATPPHEAASGATAKILSAESEEQIRFDFNKPGSGSSVDQNRGTQSFRGHSLRDASYGDRDLTPSDFGKVHYDFAKSDSTWTASAPSQQAEASAAPFPPPPAAAQTIRESSPWASVLWLASPMLGALCILALFGFWLSNTSGQNNPFFAALSSHLLYSAPAQLSIRDAGFKRITLDDGTNLNVVSGTLANDTDKALSNITLEGFAFDSKGRAIISQKAVATDKLAKTRMKSLSLDMIKNLQNSGEAKPMALKPGQKLDFSLALLPEVDDVNTEKLLSRASYFGARVHSVKR